MIIFQHQNDTINLKVFWKCTIVCSLRAHFASHWFECCGRSFDFKFFNHFLYRCDMRWINDVLSIATFQLNGFLALHSLRWKIQITGCEKCKSFSMIEYGQWIFSHRRLTVELCFAKTREKIVLFFCSERMVDDLVTALNVRHRQKVVERGGKETQEKNGRNNWNLGKATCFICAPFYSLWSRRRMVHISQPSQRYSLIKLNIYITPYNALNYSWFPKRRDNCQSAADHRNNASARLRAMTWSHWKPNKSMNKRNADEKEESDAFFRENNVRDNILKFNFRSAVVVEANTPQRKWRMWRDECNQNAAEQWWSIYFDRTGDHSDSSSSSLQL